MPVDSLTSDAADRYLAGESMKSLAARLGVSRNKLARWLRDQGIRRRGMREQKTLEAQQISPEMRAARVQAAHNARRMATLKRRVEKADAVVDELSMGRSDSVAGHGLHRALPADAGPATEP